MTPPDQSAESRFDITLRRAYEPPEQDERTRILVERLWPRGVSKQKAAIDHWMRDAAPSTELRKWYDHIPGRWPEFQRRYIAELEVNEDAVRQLMAVCGEGPCCFVFAARDVERNSAVVLKAYLDGLSD